MPRQGCRNYVETYLCIFIVCIDNCQPKHSSIIRITILSAAFCVSSYSCTDISCVENTYLQLGLSSKCTVGHRSWVLLTPWGVTSPLGEVILHLCRITGEILSSRVEWLGVTEKGSQIRRESFASMTLVSCEIPCMYFSKYCVYGLFILY